MSREARINAIFEKRLPLVRKLESVERNLKSINLKIDELEQLGEQITKNLSSTKVSINLRRLDFLGIKQIIQKESEELSKLKLRFSRKTLNIGVVGRARQGKSLLLQRLTGLTADEIPDGKRGFCTGVRSNIHHRPGEQTRGSVRFYLEQEFLSEVISLYYKAFGNTSQLDSIDDFEKYPPSPPTEESAKLKTMFGHLIDDYHSHLSEYRPLLRNQSSKEISKAEIREYVAQDDSQGNPYFNYLAVREVDIFCEFPNSDLGQIVLMDMPGLGDTRLGDEQRLIQALEQDVDFVLFVRMPSALGDDWQDFDEDLYDKARTSLRDLARRSFLILNRTISDYGDNLHNCERFKETIDSKNIKVVQCEIADCSDKTASSKVLDQVLNYLAANITHLDEEYARSYQEGLEQLQQKVNSKLNEARSLLAAYNEDSLFEDQFLELWSRVTSGLESLIERLWVQREFEEPHFKTQVETTIAKCRSDKKIPSIAAIEKERDLKESYKMAYYNYFPAIRAHLSQQFLSLNGHLQQFLESVKAEVTIVLLEEGNLSDFSSKRGSEFLKDTAHFISERRNDGKQNELRLGFQHLADFNVSYAGIIQRQIRHHLDELTADQNELPIFRSTITNQVLEKTIEWVCNTLLNQYTSGISSISLTSLPSREQALDYLEGMLQRNELEQLVDQVLKLFSNLAAGSSSIPSSRFLSKEQVIGSFYADQIRNYLSICCDEVIDKCEESLKELLCEPNQIAYSMVREFVDLIRRTEGIEKEWRIFLKREQSRVWPELKQILEYSEDREDWLKLLLQLEEINQFKNLQFLD